MDNAAYVSLGRQAGLRAEMRLVANNLANMSTDGYRRETTLFSEVVAALPVEGGSVAMSTARVRRTDFAAGDLAATGGPLDVAIDGDGFFQVETPDGPRLTRDGAFLRGADGTLATAAGDAVLDVGGAPIPLPPDAAAVTIAPDGTVAADGRPLGRIGVFLPETPADLRRESGRLFRAEAAPAAVDRPLLQGRLEGSNVEPVAEIARMIEVQRAYELGQKLLDREDERTRNAVRVLGRSS